MSSGGHLYGLLVTYKRPADLTATLRSLGKQSRRLDVLIVIDNAADAEVRRIVTENSAAAGRVDYVPAPDNLGPAGALALGTTRVINTADDDAWVIFLDDDNPPRTDDGILEIAQFGQTMLERDPRTGGVGLVGSRFIPRTGLLSRIADEDLSGPVRVSYIGGGQLPCYRATAMRAIDPPDSGLFFGFDDLEYGLRFTDAGWNLYIDGDLLARERLFYGLIGTNKTAKQTIESVSWRDYYSTRNLVWILRTRGHHLAAARLIARRVIAKAVYNAPRAPRKAWSHAALGAKATFHAYTGRMGRVVEPIAKQ